MTALNQNVGGAINFSLDSDNADWRANLTSVTYTVNGGPVYGYLDSMDRSKPGELTSVGGYGVSGTWVWTFKSTGYDDVVVVVTIPGA